MELSTQFGFQPFAEIARLAFNLDVPNDRSESTAVLTVPNRHFWSTPMNGHHQTGPVGPVGQNRKSPRHSMTSSAIESNPDERVRPSNLAVFKLMTSANLVG